MTRFSTIKKVVLRSALVAGIFLTISYSCLKVDNSMGEGLIPTDQQMTMGVVTIGGIDAYLAKYDTMRTGHFTTGLVGSIRTPDFGLTKSSFACQFLSYAFSAKDKMFGTDPTMDSLVLELYFSGTAMGDTSVMQKINVYRLNERLRKDTATTYYCFTDLASMADMSQPVFSFDYKGYKQRVRLNLTDTPYGQELIAKLSDTTGSIYTNSDKWFDRFPGWYFTTDASSPENASIVPIQFDSTNFQLWFHNPDETTGTGKKTGYLDMIMAPKNSNPLASAHSFVHDYSGSAIDQTKFNDTLPTSTPVDVSYVHGMNGVITFLRFRDSFMEDLKAKIVYPYKTMVINRAILEIPVKDPSIERMGGAFERLGAYEFFDVLQSTPDYDYEAEESGITIPFGGYLNFTHNNYPMNITLFVQNMVVSRKENEEPPVMVMELGPSFREVTRVRETVLNTSNKPDNPQPMRVHITYTLVK